MNGKMVDFMKDNTNMIKNMVMEAIVGQMEEDILESGPIAREMEKEKL